MLKIYNLKTCKYKSNYNKNYQQLFVLATIVRIQVK